MTRTDTMKMKVFVQSLVMFMTLATASLEVEARDRFYILAVSWQPAFCEGRSDRPECASQIPTRYDATHFSLHGLWPQPRSNVYCGVSESLKRIDKSGKWGQLPPLKMPASLLSRLGQVMPGTQSNLQRHEWVKHGTCFENGEAENYYVDSLRLMNELNASGAQELFASNIGKYISLKEIQAQFDRSFGKGAGKRIRLRCNRDGNRNLIAELTLGLYGQIDDDVSLADLMLAARGTKGGCKGGIVDPAELQ